MTQGLGEGFGWVYLVVGLAWYTDKTVGSGVDLRAATQRGLAALDRAGNGQRPAGARGPRAGPDA
jgi:hypothetical protein